MRHTRIIVTHYGGPDALRVVEGHSGGRHRYRAILIFGLYIAGSWLLPGRKRVVPYIIQTLKRLKPALFRQDLITLFELLQKQKIKPLSRSDFLWPRQDKRMSCSAREA